MSGKSRIVNGEIAQGKLKGKALADALFKEMNSSEKDSDYQGTNTKKNGKKK